MDIQLQLFLLYLNYIFCVFGFLLITLKIYKKYVLYGIRSSLFSVRNDFFTKAFKVNLDFDHPAYRRTEKNINDLITYLDHISFRSFLKVAVDFKDKEKRERVKKRKEIRKKEMSNLSEEQKDLLGETYDLIDFYILDKMFKSNFFVSCFIHSLLMCFCAVRFGRGAKQAFMDTMGHQPLLIAFRNKTWEDAHCFGRHQTA